MVPVHQLDPEPLRFGIDHEPITGAEAIEGVAARLLIEVSTGDIDRRVAVDQRLRQQFRDDALAQAREQHKVT